jgi:hypothetical protein
MALLEMLKPRIEDEDEDLNVPAWRVSVQQLAVRDDPLDQFKTSLERLVKKLVPTGTFRGPSVPRYS